jgi:hypothetical protein
MLVSDANGSAGASSPVRSLSAPRLFFVLSTAPIVTSLDSHGGETG